MSNGVEKNFNFGSFNFIDGDDRSLTGVETDDNQQSRLTYTFVESDIGIKTFKGKFTGDGTYTPGTSNDFTVKVTAADGQGGNQGQAKYVTQIVAGPGIYISPANGRGVVTISTKPFTGPTTNDLLDVAWTKSVSTIVAEPGDVGDQDADSDDLYTTAKKGGYFVASGADGVTLISSDGDNWINLGPKSGAQLIQGVAAMSEQDTTHNLYRTLFFGVGSSTNNTPLNYFGNEQGWYSTFSITNQTVGFTTPYIVGTSTKPEFFGGGVNGIFHTAASNNYIENGWSREYNANLEWIINEFADDSDNSGSYKMVAVATAYDANSGQINPSSGQILYSARTAGSSGTWSPVYTTDNDSPVGVATDGNGNWVAVGNLGGIYISSDAETWSFVDPTFLASWSYVAYGNGKFVAVGYSTDGVNGAVMYSEDAGQTWTKGSAGANAGLNSVAYSPDLNVFVAVGNGGTTVSVSG